MTRRKQRKQGQRKDGTSLHSKGYFVVKSGPLRDQYIHRIVAAAMLGRDLKKDEEVHHANGDKKDFHWRNLVVIGQSDHGWVSAKQAYYMRQKDLREKAEWDAFMAEQAEGFRSEVKECRANQKEWKVRDRKVQKAWARKNQKSLHANSATPAMKSTDAGSPDPSVPF